MDDLIKRLQQHPKVILFMFAVTLVSGLMGILLGWERLYTDFLSKSVTLPAWAIVTALGAIAVSRIYLPNRRASATELSLVEGQVFGVQQVVMDGKRFLNCTFDGTELIFRGEAAFDLERNRFVTPPRFLFEGNAGTSLLVIQALYQSKEFRPIMEKTLLHSVLGKGARS